ncbi:SCO family protein [Pontibacillus litoralis]|uniref:Thioredoxin domain-containing protein n=1 Tax=Pontibacillus litoralis JSM 072002 TaxID=1385512 RepID=A0A0A5G8V5_9BACI|nr:SCO family protein [Pontibacillus litoralis]KGX87525.1 hypothetical protein N784_14865 [Pontibacillus litoralis JSM 072002]
MKQLKWLVLLVMIPLLAACGGEEIETNMSETVQDFSYTNQAKETVSLGDYEGQWWVADFIFTNCNTVCPPMTSNMAKVQQAAKEKELDIQFVSFSVDPENDTPNKLKEFGDQHGADYNNWSFLTGYEFQEIKEFGMKSFKTLIDDIENNDQMLHQTSFYLVNPQGKVVKKYNGIQQEQVELLISDIEQIQ